MATINDLPFNDTPNLSDSVPIYKTSSGVTQRTSVNQLLAGGLSSLPTVQPVSGSGELWIDPLDGNAVKVAGPIGGGAPAPIGQQVFADYGSLRAYTGTGSLATITTVGIGGQFIKLSNSAGMSDNGGTIVFDAKGNAWQRIFTGPTICAEWFGWIGGEPGAVLNAAQAAAVFHKCTEVTYSSPNYLQTTPINAVNGIVIRGPGTGPEGVIRVVAGTSIDAQYQTPNFESQYASQPTTSSQGVIRDFGLVNVCLDGNCGSNKNTPVTTNALKGMGFRVYGKRPKFRNVWVMRQPGIGVYSFFTATPTEIDFGNTLGSESRDGSYFENICVEDSQYEGLVFQGPSDIDVSNIRVAWPSNSLWSATYTAKKSLLFPTARLQRVLPGAAGSGYTQAATSCTVSTDATTPPAVVPIVVNGAVDHYMITSSGSSDATFCNVTVTGDGTGATAVGYIGNWISGMLVFNKGAEFTGCAHSYGNVQGPAIEVRNDDSGASPRFNASFLIGEGSVGGIVISDHTEYQIDRCDTHGNGGYSSPGAIPSLLITSDRGGMISNWKERRDLATGSGLSALIRGRGNVVKGRVQSNSGYAGDAVLVGGFGNSVDLHVQDVSGYALALDYDVQCANFRLTSLSNGGVAKSYANAATISNINCNIDIASYGSVALATSYLGFNNFSTGQWSSIRAIDKRSDTGSIAYAHGSVSGAIDLTLTTEQVLTLTNPCVRIPAFSDLKVQTTPNSGATFGTLQYAYVSAVSQTQLTVRVKFATAGTGAGQCLVSF